jgi:VWFA-related protein
MSKYLRFFTLLLFLSIILQSGIAQTASEQTAQPPTLRTNTQMVVVDVVATDRKGQSVPNLTADDFIVLEDGKPQKVANFTLERATGKAVIKPVAQLPPTVITNAPRFSSGSLSVILFDGINGDSVEHAYARNELLKFLNANELARPVAIFAMQDQLKLLSDFTTDSKALAAIVAKYRAPVKAATAETFQSRESPFTTLGAFNTTNKGIEDSLIQLNQLAKILAGYPGRKNLIWLSESFPLTLFPEGMRATNMSGPDLHSNESAGGPTAGVSQMEMMLTQSPIKNYAALVKKVADALMTAQVAVYPVDAGALNKDDHLAAQDTMDEMAEDTGGEAFKNSNDLALSLKTSIEDGATYYTLSYYPENKNWDGRFRTIRIKSNQEKINLHYRQGYYAVNPEKLMKEDTDAAGENFSRALQLSVPDSTSIIFQAQVKSPSDKNGKILVTFHIDPQTIAFEHKNGDEEYAKLNCTVWAYGKNREKPDMFNGTVTANLKPKDYQQMMQQHFLPCTQELDLKPGTYTLRLGVLDRAASRIGTASYVVTVQ